MSAPSLTLAEPLTMGQTSMSRSARCNSKFVAVLSMLMGFALALLIVPRTSGSEHGASTMLFSRPLALRPHAGFMAPPSTRPVFTADAKPRSKKEKEVVEIRPKLQDSSLIVVANYGSMPVKENQKMREMVKDTGGNLQFVKNNLARIALEGTGKENLQTLLGGSLGFFYSQDPVETAKALVKIEKEFNPSAKDKKADPDLKDKITFKGGSLEGVLFTPEKIKELSQMPTVDESMARLIGSLNAPASNLASRVNGVSSKLARVLQAVADKKAEEAGGAPAEVAA